ncbi:MAG: hypothetical protein WCG75_04020 [Armatimonadota bacterium]
MRYNENIVRPFDARIWLLPAIAIMMVAGCSLDQGTRKIGHDTRSTEAAPANPPHTLSHRFVGIATLRPRNAQFAEERLEANHIPFGTFDNLTTIGIVVDPAYSERARTIIHNDSVIHGYSMHESAGVPTTPPIENPQTISGQSSSSTTPTTAPSPAKLPSKFITLVEVAAKDVKSVVACLNANGISTPGTWQAKDIGGIVVSESDANRALTIIKADAKLHHYSLIASLPKDSNLRQASADWDSIPKSADDLSAVGTMIGVVALSKVNDISAGLEAHNISSFSSCGNGTCEIYVAKLDADRAHLLVEENAKLKGYYFGPARNQH